MKKKLLKHAFATAFSGSVTKQFAAEGADVVELVALPVLPASPFRTVDSRSGLTFSYDAAALVAVHAAKGRKLPLDIEHATEGGAADTRARGWVHSLTTAEAEPEMGLEPGVLYAWTELTPLGKQELNDKLWGYTSGVALGVWLDEQSIQFTRIKSLALTNNPATEMPMNFTADGDADGESEDDGDTTAENASSGAAYTEQLTAEQQTMLNAILEQLGLPADATQEQVSAALEALRTPAPSEAEQALTACGFTAADLTAGAVVRTEQLTAATEQVTSLTAKVETLTTELTAAQAEVSSLKAAEAERLVFAAVDAVIAARKATPAQRDALARIAKADLAAFKENYDAALEVLPDTAPIRHAAADAHGLTADQLAFCKTHRIDPAIYAKNLSAI